MVLGAKSDIAAATARLYAEQSCALALAARETDSLEKIKEQNPFIIFPLEFPKKPKVGDPHIALQYSNEQLKHWDMAPDNIQKVFNEGMRFCFTAGTLKKKSDFRKNIQYIFQHTQNTSKIFQKQ